MTVGNTVRASRLTGHDLAALCEDALAKSIALFPASLGAILLVTSSGDLVVRHVATVRGRGEPVNVCDEVAEDAAIAGEMSIVGDTSDDPRTTAQFDAGLRSIVAIPLCHSGERLGLLYLDSTEPLGDDSAVAIRLCDLMAGQLSAEIQVARVATALVEARR